jgi:integrase/recombinase XerD
MTSLIVPADVGEATPPVDPRPPLAVAAYLARFAGLSRQHTASDLRALLGWCAKRDIEPLGAQRQHLELYVRWMQETRRYKPSTVSRRTSVLAGFYRTCVIDGMPTVEALLTAARESSKPNDFGLVAMLGLLGLRIFEATGTNVGDLCEEHGHRVLRVVGKGTRIVLVPLPAVGRAVDRAVDGRDRADLA